MPRRVVRSLSDSPLSDTPKKNHFQFCGSFFACFRRILFCIWCCIKVLWYWIERILLVLLLVALTAGLAWWLSQKPSHMRDWLSSENTLSTVIASGNLITIENVRNHRWTTDRDFIPGYYTRTYNLDEIESLYYLITPFSDHDGPAHTMLSFTFSGGVHVVISGEVRKERGESFDALKGILNQFELMYVIADEQDVIELRTTYRKNNVYMYPIKTEKEKIQQLFRAMTLRAEKLRLEPEFYNTLWNNCTTSILIHANALREEKLPWNTYTILPSHSDELVYAAGLIDTKLSLSQAREYYMISDRARNSTGSTDFSQTIRIPKK